MRPPHHIDIVELREYCCWLSLRPTRYACVFDKNHLFIRADHTIADSIPLQSQTRPINLTCAPMIYSFHEHTHITRKLWMCVKRTWSHSYSPSPTHSPRLSVTHAIYLSLSHPFNTSQYLSFSLSCARCDRSMMNDDEIFTNYKLFVVHINNRPNIIIVTPIQ